MEKNEYKTIMISKSDELWLLQKQRTDALCYLQQICNPDGHNLDSEGFFDLWQKINNWVDDCHWGIILPAKSRGELQNKTIGGVDEKHSDIE